MNLAKLCTPALVYFVIAIVVLSSAFIMRMMSIPVLAIKVLFVAVWTWFLNFLCSNNYTGISWFLVIIPYLFTAFIVGIVYESQQHVANQMLAQMANQ